MSEETQHSPPPSLPKKQKIFNVRKLPYKQFDNQKFLKRNMSPLLKREPFTESTTNLSQVKNLEYQYQLAIVATPEYKKMQGELMEVRRRQREERQQKLRVLRMRQTELEGLVRERVRVREERRLLVGRRNAMRRELEVRQERAQEGYCYEEGEEGDRAGEVEYLRSMLMNVHYQGGWDIDIDRMTYEELLQLQEKMGKVSKGLSPEVYAQLPREPASEADESEVCSVCYENLKRGEEVHKLPCRHVFHCECIAEWFREEKVCPLCKQEVGASAPPTEQRVESLPSVASEALTSNQSSGECPSQ